MRKKITVVGAGNVGREVAFWCAIKELGDIVLWNRSKAKALGNAMDLMEAGPLAGFDAKIKGTNNINATKNSDIIVFTAGSPRKPGMSREELVKGNALVVKSLVKKLSLLSPKAKLIMVTNPLDAMAFVAMKASRFPRSRVIGMAGILDTSRFKSFIAKELNVSVSNVSALVLGSHGENMVPLPRLASVGGVSLDQLLSKKKIAQLVQHTKDAGLEIVTLLKANASFSTGAAASVIVESIVRDKKEVLPCSVFLRGEFGVKDVFLGVPCVVGAKGVEGTVTLRLSSDEKRELKAAAKRIKALQNSAW